MARNYRAELEYDGTEYAGFQVQVAQSTIQGQVEAALLQITGSAIRIEGAGRTDAGVHARGQVISFQSEWLHEAFELQRALNAVLPADIAIRSLGVASEAFHARFSALTRTYIYNLYQDPVRSPLKDRYALHIAKELDLVTMQLAADNLIGQHDFAAFGQDPRNMGSTVRRVFGASWHRREHSQGPQPVETKTDLQFVVTADAFLRGMVRRIVGNLIQVGLGQLSVGQFAEVQQGKSPARSAPPAPARGLCFWKVQYEDENGQLSRPFDERRSRST